MSVAVRHCIPNKKKMVQNWSPTITKRNRWTKFRQNLCVHQGPQEDVFYNAPTSPPNVTKCHSFYVVQSRKYGGTHWGLKWLWAIPRIKGSPELVRHKFKKKEARCTLIFIAYWQVIGTVHLPIGVFFSAFMSQTNVIQGRLKVVLTAIV